MFRSVRARLTLWHTGVLAVLLALFAAAAYAFVVRTTNARTDRVLLQAVDGLDAELSAERQDAPTDRQAAEEVVRELRFRGFAYIIYDTAGAVVAASVPRPAMVPRGEDPDPPFDPANLGRLVRGRTLAPAALVSLPDPEGGYRAAVAPARLPGDRYVVAVAQSEHDEQETLEDARVAMLVAIPIGLLLAALGGSLLARRSLAPMVMMRDRAAHIGATSLGERLPIATPDDEVGQLAGVINELLARLERAFQQQRQFMADASHELRTPVAVVQNEASVALSGPRRSAAEYADALGVIREAGRRLRRIVDDLFLLARADAGDVPLRPVPLYLDELVTDCVRSLRSLADARRITVRCEMPEGEVPLTGDEDLLRRLVVNLVDNAIKYSPPGATVTVRLERVPGGLRLLVADTGPGIPADVQPRIFERFVRADRARGRSMESATSGAGLGLAIARWIADVHGATLTLVRSDAAGSVFALTLPDAGL